MRCPDCNKFVSFEEAEPEVESLEAGTDGTVTATVRIVNTCMECSQELTEATLDLESQDVCQAASDHQCTAKKDATEKESFEAEEDSCERVSKSGYYKKGKWVDAFGRYTKTFYGAELTATVKCSHCDQAVREPVTLADYVQASSMEPLV